LTHACHPVNLQLLTAKWQASTGISGRFDRNNQELNHLRKTILNNHVNDIENEDIDDTYICPECKNRMTVIYEIVPDIRVNFEIFGFTHGPPQHGTIQKAA